jgi:hypothetical protein
VFNAKYGDCINLAYSFILNELSTKQLFIIFYSGNSFALFEETNRLVSVLLMLKGLGPFELFSSILIFLVRVSDSLNGVL